MSIASLLDFKDYRRGLMTYLDNALQTAPNAATIECNQFVGFVILDRYGRPGPPSDIVFACMLFADVKADVRYQEANEARRAFAQWLMLPYRLKTETGA